MYWQKRSPSIYNQVCNRGDVMGAKYGSLRHKLKRSLEIATIVFLLMLFIALIVVIIMDVNLIFRCRRTGISVNRRVEKTTVFRTQLYQTRYIHSFIYSA